MTEYKKFLEEAAKRDHRRIGKVSLIFDTEKPSVNPMLTEKGDTRIKNSSSSTSSVLEVPSGYPTELGFTTPLLNLCA